MPRSALLTILAVAILIPAAKAQTVTCVAAAGERLVRSSGGAERVSDILLTCSGSQQAAVTTPTPMTLQLTLNVHITNTTITQGSTAVNAIAVVNGNNCGAPALSGPTFGSCGAPNPAVQDPQYGLRSAVNRLQWSLELPPIGAGSTSTVRLTGVRANVTQVAPQGGLITAFLSSQVAISNNVLTVARSSNQLLPGLGVYIDGSWFLDRNGDEVFNSATEVSSWGSPGDTPMPGDWNGDGVADLGVFSGGTWFIDASGNRAFDAATDIKGWGVAGWIPITGDWNGDRKTDLGAIEPSTMTWFRDMNGDFAFNAGTEVHGWGSPGDTPVVGDWDGDGDDDLGVFSGGLWFIDFNGNRTFEAGMDVYGWGVAGWTPVVGDWDGDGDDDLGAVESSTSTWFRDVDGNKLFNPATEVLRWGSLGDRPVVVDWNVDGEDEVGVYSGGVWLVDTDGSQTFNPLSELKPWGVAGWALVPGVWR